MNRGISLFVQPCMKRLAALRHAVARAAAVKVVAAWILDYRKQVRYRMVPFFW